MVMDDLLEVEPFFCRERVLGASGWARVKAAVRAAGEPIFFALRTSSRHKNWSLRQKKLGEPRSLEARPSGWHDEPVETESPSARLSADSAFVPGGDTRAGSASGDIPQAAPNTVE